MILGHTCAHRHFQNPIAIVALHTHLSMPQVAVCSTDPSTCMNEICMVCVFFAPIAEAVQSQRDGAMIELNRPSGHSMTNLLVLHYLRLHSI
jgi:hypothetical protein